MDEEEKLLSVDKDTALRIALSMHFGEKCKYCLKEFQTVEDFESAVWVGCHDHGRIAHEACYKQAQESET
jgi:hypothetical protein